MGWPLISLTKGGLAFAEGGLKVGRVLRIFAAGGLAFVIGREEGGLPFSSDNFRSQPHSPIIFFACNLIGPDDGDGYRTLLSENFLDIRRVLSDHEPDATSMLSDHHRMNRLSDAMSLQVIGRFFSHRLLTLSDF